MNKKLFATLFTILKISAEATKEQNLEQLFDLMHPVEEMTKAYEPFLANITAKDEETKNKIKEKSLKKYFENLKKEFTKAYDKIFDESEVKELLKFYKSPVGKKFVKKSLEISAGMTKAYTSFMPIVKEVTDEFMPKEAKIENKEENKNSNVIKFHDLVKEKDSAEEIFEKEIKNNDLTIVKFSTVWCPPCNTYEPIFKEFANENSEITFNDKKLKIKYLLIDTDEWQSVAIASKVTSIPATHFFKNGKLVDKVLGIQSKEDLKNKIKEILQK